MTTAHNVPLSPDDEAQLEDLLADANSPADRLRFEKVLRPYFQAAANTEAHWRNVFREQHAYAVAQGFLEPDEFARTQTDYLKRLRKIERRAEADQKRLRAQIAGYADKAARKREASSKTARQRLRVRPSDELKYVRILGEFEKLDVDLSSPLVTEKIEKKIGCYTLPHWEKARTGIKLLAIAVESERQGATAFHLRFGKDIWRRAHANSRGPTSYIQDRLRKALKKHLADDAPEFWFVVEPDRALGRFHVHGAVLAQHNGPGMDLVSQALFEASAWEGDDGSTHAVVLSPLVTPYWFAAYLTKTLNLTATLIDQKLLVGTQGIMRDAKRRWPSLQRALPATPRGR